MEGPNNERVSERYDDVRELKRRPSNFLNTNSIEQVKGCTKSSYVIKNGLTDPLVSLRTNLDTPHTKMVPGAEGTRLLPVTDESSIQNY